MLYVYVMLIFFTKGRLVSKMELNAVIRRKLSK